MGKYKNITIIRTQTNTTHGPRHTRASSAYIFYQPLSRLLVFYGSTYSSWFLTAHGSYYLSL